MKKFTLALSALAMMGAMSLSAQEDVKLIVKANFNGNAANFGHYMSVNADDAALKMINDPADETAHWTITENEDGSKTIKNVGDNTYLYLMDGQAYGSDDPVNVYTADSPAIAGAIGFTTTANASTDSSNWLNINGANGTTLGHWSLDGGSSFIVMTYVEGQTDEEVQAAVHDALDAAAEAAAAAAAKAQRIDRLTAYANASTSGKEMISYIVGQMEYSIENESEADQDLTYTNMANAAGSMFLSDFQNSVRWINKRTEQNIAYMPDNESTPVQRTADFTNNAIWQAEMLDVVGTTVASSFDARFMIKNVASGKYLGIQPANQPVPVVDTNENAAIYKLVAASTGFQIICINSDVENNYLNCSSWGPDTKLTVWNFADDAGANWIVENAATLTGSSADFTGEFVDDGWGGKTFTEINGFTITVPEGAQPSGIGSVVVANRDWSTGIDTPLFQGKIAELAFGEPEKVTEQVYVGYDPETYMPIYEDKTFDRYTFVLNPTRSEPGEYRIDVDAYAFSLTNAEGTTEYTAAIYGSTFIEEAAFALTVTPEEGTVLEIAEITLNAEGGIAPNWNYADDYNVTLKHSWSEVTGYDPEMGDLYQWHEETILDLNQEAIQEFDSFDWDDPTKPAYTIPVGATAAGDYNLFIPAGFFENDSMVQNEDTFVSWTIEVVDGIKTITDVKVNGESIYDLSGRKVSKASKGLFIINGVKTLVK